jgi:hypothetical protein
MADVRRCLIGIVAERQAVANAWVDHRWRVTAILPGAPAVPAWTCLEQGEGWRRYYAGSAELLLFPRETETLKYNIEGEAPAVYVFLRATAAPPGMALVGATVCVGEAHAHVDAGGDLVEAVPMPPAIRMWIGDFVAEHHTERPTWKRQRDGVRGRVPGGRVPGERVPSERGQA